MNYYQFHIGDFDRATRHLTRIERSIYRDLMDVYYDTEQALTLDMTALCRRVIARTDEEATAVEQVLNEFFTKTPDGWYHIRCESVIEEYHASTSQKSAAGRASAAKREAKRQQALNGKSTVVETPFNGTPTNQEPLTINQEPKEEHMSGTTIPNCPHAEIIEAYNATLATQGLTAVKLKLWSGQRKSHLSARWREDPERQSLEWWQGLFDYIATVDFLMGRARTDRPWQADLGWIVTANNMVKILEGKYHG